MAAQPSPVASVANGTSSVTTSTAPTAAVARHASAVSSANARASSARSGGGTADSRDLPRAGGFTGRSTACVGIAEILSGRSRRTGRWDR